MVNLRVEFSGREMILIGRALYELARRLREEGKDATATTLEIIGTTFSAARWEKNQIYTFFPNGDTVW